MKLALPAAVAAVLVTSSIASTPATADEGIVVKSSHPGLGHWVASTSESLSRNLDTVVPLAMPRRITGGGTFAAVTFALGADGRPTEIAVARPSSSAEFDQMAMNAVKRLDTGDARPREFAAGQRFRAYMIVATSYEARDRLNREVLRQERLRRSNPSSLAANEIALGVAL